MIELVFASKEEARTTSLKCIHDVFRNGIQQLENISLAEQFLGKRVELLNLSPALIGRICLPAYANGKLAAHDRGHQECKKRHPVLRIGNCEGADWGQEEEIESQHGGHRHNYGYRPTPQSGNSENREKKRKPDSCLIHSR